MIDPCDTCGHDTINPANDYGEFVCDDCEQNINERKWERQCGSYYGGDGPKSLHQQQIEARRFK